MINLAPIPSKVQQRLFEKMRALSRGESYPETPIYEGSSGSEYQSDSSDSDNSDTWEDSE